jgi:hypothetical protein
MRSVATCQDRSSSAGTETAVQASDLYMDPDERAALIAEGA